MLSVSEMRALDKNADFFGVPPSMLMENAGRGVADYIRDAFTPHHALIICGPGNNGGDGLVAARYLAAHCQVTVALTCPPQKIKSQLAQANYNKVQKLGVRTCEYSPNLLEGPDVAVDAMLGIGIQGPLRDPYATIVQQLNTSRLPLISVDIPTGLGGPLAVKPQSTITFHDTKEGMTPQTCGTIIIHDIGIPPHAVTHVGPGSLVYYPHPQDTSHKGENGRVLVVAGGPYTGAPALVGLAALRTGADLVFIATPETCWPIVASFSPNLIVCPLQGSTLSSSHIPQINNLLPRVDTVVIGPGLGHGQDTVDSIPPLVDLCINQEKSLVIDADAISSLGGMHNLQNIVVTPHQHEFKNLTGKNSERQQVQLWAKKLGVTFLVKGHVDLITDGTQVKLNQVHNVGMTVGGTGDVLSGIIGSLLGKKIDPFHAACMGAFLNGIAGNMAYETLSYGLVATDIVDRIPLVLKNYL